MENCYIVTESEYDALFGRILHAFAQISRRIAQILFAKTVEVLGGRKIKFVDNV